MSYPIAAPVDFTNASPTDTINFNADVGTNKIQNFVVNTAGDMLYRPIGASNYLDRLPIGADGTFLSAVAGVPAWVASPSTGGQDVFSARISGSLAGIPTSRVGGANPGTWFGLYGNTAPGPFVTWAEMVDPDNVFESLPGANYGTFQAPTTGIYYFSALITFDSGAGVTAGAGLPAASLPSGMAVRQVQIYNVTTSTPIQTFTRQVEASNSNATVCPITVDAVGLVVGDRVGIRVRHDRTAVNTVTIGNGALVLPSQSYFSGCKLR